MAIIQVQPNQGFFGAAKQSFEDQAARSQQLIMQERELEVAERGQRLQKQQVDLQAQAQEFEQGMIQQQIAGRGAALQAMGPQLAELGFTEEQLTAGAQSPEFFAQLMGQASQLQTQGVQRGLVEAETRDIGFRQGMASEALDLERQIAEATDENAKAALGLEHRKLTEGMRQFDLDSASRERLSVAELALSLGRNPSDLNSQLFADPTGNPETILAQDQAAFEAAGNTGDFGEFVQGQRLQRAFGLFGLPAEGQANLESLLADNGPEEALKQVLEDEQLSPEDKALVFSVIKVAFPDSPATQVPEGASFFDIFGFELAQGLRSLGERQRALGEARSLQGR